MGESYKTNLKRFLLKLWYAGTNTEAQGSGLIQERGLDVVAHTILPALGGRGRGCHKFKSSLGCMVNSRQVRIID